MENKKPISQQLKEIWEEKSMETKHTKGEWRTDRQLNIMSDSGRIAIVKRIETEDENNSSSKGIAFSEQEEANAKLIEAAPELLETIIDILESFYHPDGSCIIKKDSIIHKRMKLLIKKATE